MSVIGTMEAVQGVMVSADLPGTVAKIDFESGQAVQEETFWSSSIRGRSGRNWRRWKPSATWPSINFGRMQQLVKEASSRGRSTTTPPPSRRQTEAQVGEIRATIERKTIRAPFSGILGIRQVNLGQYLAAAMPIVPLQSLNPIYVNFGVPQQAAGQVQVGRILRVTTEDLAGQAFTGRVTALDSVVDEATRNIQVQATLANPEGKLRPGMFVQVEVGARRRPHRSLPLPASAINYAPYGDSVFVVTDLKDPKGTDLPRRAPAVREARRFARRSGRRRLRREAGR